MHIYETWKRALAVLLCGALFGPACATAGAGRISSPQAPDPVTTAAVADFVRKLPPGTVVQVDRTAGSSVRGTLLKATADLVVIQPKTRLPEPAVEIPVGEILRVTPQIDGKPSLAKVIGAGVAAGAGAAIGVFLLLLAAFAD